MADRSLALMLTQGLASVGKAALSPSLASPARPGGYFGLVREPFAGAWQMGEVQVDPMAALTSFGAVYACISRIADDIAKLGGTLQVPDAEGLPVPVPDGSPFWATIKQPNPFQNLQQFVSLWLCSKLMYGNFCALKGRESVRGLVRRLYPLDWRRVTPLITPEGDVYYSLGGSDLARIPQGIVVPASEVVHDRCITLWHPLIGVSPLYASALSATMGRRMQMNSARFFENMSRPSGMLSAPGSISDDTAARLKKEWEQNYSGLNIGRLAIGGDGLKYEPMTIPAEQAQLIEQLEWTSKDVAGTFHMPLYKIGVGAMPSSDNVEALELQYYSGCLQAHIESIETLLTDGLELPNRYFFEFDLDGLGRMDARSAIETLAKAVGGTVMTPNEARRKRRLPKKPGGDALYLQQQNYSLEALAKRDARPDPFAAPKPPTPPRPEPAPGPEPDDDAARRAEEAAKALATAIAAAKEAAALAERRTAETVDAIQAVAGSVATDLRAAQEGVARALGDTAQRAIESFETRAAEVVQRLHAAAGETVPVTLETTDEVDVDDFAAKLARALQSAPVPETAPC